MSTKKVLKKIIKNGVEYELGGGIDKVPGTTYLTQTEYDNLPSSKLTNNENYGIYESSEDTTISKFIKNGIEYPVGGSSGPKYGYIDLLVVGGGGASGGGSRAGGGGAGGFVECECLPINSNSDYFSVYVGRGGSSRYTNGDCSYFWEVTANGGGAGGCSTPSYCRGKGGASGGGGAGYCVNVTAYGGTGTQGGNGGNGNQSGGGGGGAGGNGCNQLGQKGGNGGIGKCSFISGELQWYAGGGAGGSNTLVGGADCQAYGGCGGGGDGNCDATYYGGGGGGQNYLRSGTHDGIGYQGVVILRYKTNGSSGLLPTSSGGCKYTCGEYTIHCFTNAGNIEQFVPVFK